MDAAAIAIVAAAVLGPLAWEYADFRRSWGLGRAGALGTTLLVLPAVGIGLTVALPLATWPTVRWAATVVVGLGVYSLAVRAIGRAALASKRASARLGSE